MNKKIRNRLARRKRRIEKRLDKTKFSGDGPMIAATNIHYELADRTQAVGAGGIGMMHQLVKRLELDKAINQHVPIFKLYLPYSESDHVLNMAYNLLAGGTCLEHLELRRNDEAYLDALGARRIPDPTTAGDFCRRFGFGDIFALLETFNATRLKVWSQQPASFFEEAIVEADGTMVETYGECKQGIDINHKGQWGYHPLIVSLANTGEPLYLANRSGNRPSHEDAAFYLDQSITLCRKAGFRKITLRGDTDFTQTEKLDGWDADGVEFVFGIDAMPNLYKIVENLPASAWKRLKRRPAKPVKTAPRARPENVKQRIVEEREFTNIKLCDEHVAEFDYSPTKCKTTYRVVVVWKDLEVSQGQQKLFDDSKCFFYITNKRKCSAAQVVFEANDRCNQENLIEQHKNGVRALTAPLDNLESNWAYMVIASLAWSLKAWAALLLPVNPRWKEKHEREKRSLLRMDFATFRNALINVPAQIIRSGQQIIYRLLAWNPWQAVFFRLVDQLRKPLRC
ncbi:MAG: IS1380 family transposase [Hyphomicrobiales bacterium]|nr:IS1380 family transposase [Hyphomicrobiales bacterium]